MSFKSNQSRMLSRAFSGQYMDVCGNMYVGSCKTYAVNGTFSIITETPSEVKLP